MRHWLAALIVFALAPLASAQVAGPPTPAQFAAQSSAAQASAGPANEGPVVNPLTVLEGAAGFLSDGGSGGTGSTDDPEPSKLSAAVNVMLLLTVITLAPTVMLMTTSFLRVLIVLGLLKQALGTQSLPPGQVITALALFMTMVVMTPTIDRVWDEAIVPYTQGEIRDYDTLWIRTAAPVRDFMFDQIETTGNWSSLYMVLEKQGVDTSRPETLTRDDVSTTALIPAYMLSELKVAFIMGFRVYLPFLVIDMVIASLLISMSMMMLPPVLISLPFKLMLFVMVDGWSLVVGSLIDSFSRPGINTAVASVPAFLSPMGFG
ncbi:MAG: flagellar type III secretion system pore protein FliP [Planctomycetota bacterium]